MGQGQKQTSNKENQMNELHKQTERLTRTKCDWLVKQKSSVGHDGDGTLRCQESEAVESYISDHILFHSKTLQGKVVGGVKSSKCGWPGEQINSRCLSI